MNVVTGITMENVTFVPLGIGDQHAHHVQEDLEPMRVQEEAHVMKASMVTEHAYVMLVEIMPGCWDLILKDIMVIVNTAKIYMDHEILVMNVHQISGAMNVKDVVILILLHLLNCHTFFNQQVPSR